METAIQAKESAIKRVYQSILKNLRYRKNGQLFRQDRVDVMHFIHAKSRRMDASLFTLNFGVVVKSIYETAVPLAKATSGEWHVRLWYPPEGSAAVFSGDSGVDSLYQQLTTAVEQTIIPLLEEYASASAVRDAWLEERATGVSQQQRHYLLAMLLHEEGRIEEAEREITKLEQSDRGRVSGRLLRKRFGL